MDDSVVGVYGEELTVWVGNSINMRTGYVGSGVNQWGRE